MFQLTFFQMHFFIEYCYLPCNIVVSLFLIGCLNLFQGSVGYILASLFLHLNESTCQNEKNVFYFTSKALFVLEKMKF